MRGKVHRVHRRRKDARITPAHAGKSSPLCLCGYNALGSPPRMRGKVINIAICNTITGITPAHAGKSIASSALCHPQRDHPRACGEKRNYAGGNRAVKGSPPRMRGKVTPKGHDFIASGITPAHAGKSFFELQAVGIAQDHPRACGEKAEAQATLRMPAGSPPRMRGKD